MPHLAQNVVSAREGFIDRHGLGQDLKELVVGHHDERVYVGLHISHGFRGLA